MHLCGQDLRRRLEFVSVCVGITGAVYTHHMSENTRACINRCFVFFLLGVFEQVTISTRGCQKFTMSICHCLQMFPNCYCYLRPGGVCECILRGFVYVNDFVPVM